MSALVVATLGAGCKEPDPLEPEKTIRVVTWTDTPQSFDRLRITVERLYSDPPVVFTEDYGRETIDSLPESLLLKNGKPYDALDEVNHEILRISVLGLPAASDDPSSNVPVIRRSAELPFVLEHPVILRLPLCSSCTGVSNGCLPEASCIEGLCKDSTVEPDNLPEETEDSPFYDGSECPSAN